MSATVSDFWKLLADSRLLAPLHIQQLAADFAKQKHAAEPTAKTLAQWLVAQKALSRYQATVLLAGRSGPFYYGDYKVLSRVEQGRLAGCFRAQHTATGHPVLLKFLTGSLISEARQWEAAVRAAQPCFAINSPHLQRYFELVDLPKFKFLVSEDLRGAALDEKLATGRLPPPEACRVARLTALGLAAMHAGGRVHGDLRTASVLLTDSTKQPPAVKLLYEPHIAPAPLDFSDTQPTGRLAQVADYLAPELWMPGRAPDPLTDLYALGCIFYAMLAGALPFAGGDIPQKLAGHTSQPIKPLEPLGVPQPLAQLVTYLLAKNPSVRYASAELVAEQLALFVEPAALRMQPPAPLPTLRTYEQAISKPVMPATPAEKLPVVTVASPAPSVAFGPATAPPSPPNVFVPAASTSPALDIQIPSKAKPALSAAEILRRRKQQRRRNLVIGLAASCVLIAAAAGAGFWWTQYGGAAGLIASAPQGPEADGAPAVMPTTHSDDSDSPALPDASGPTAKPIAGSQQIIPDDGRALWASPTTGQPIEFRCVPPEAQVFLVVRPSAMLATDEGPRVFAALGPEFAAQRAAFEDASGFKLEDIEQLTITLHNNDAKFPRVNFVVKTRQTFTPQELTSKWGNPAANKERDETYYAGPKWSYYIPSSTEGARTFALGEPRDIKEVAAVQGAPPNVIRDVERLRRATDNQRHFTLLFYPQFLFNDDGEPLFAGERAKVRQPLDWLLGDHLQAAAVSGFFGDAFYFEARLVSSLDKEPYQLADELRSRLNQVPASLENYFVSLDPPSYWKKLAFRFPGMIHELHAQTRIGVENDQAVLNAVLPPAAAHNLSLGGELLVSTTPGRAVATTATPQASGPKTITEALQLKTSFSFDSQSLEFAMRDLAEDVKGNLKGAPFEFAIKIIGDDLKLEGITRNQSIRDFRQENQTVADILTALVRKANPVTTVQDPSEKDQKLVWLIGPDPDDPSKQVVLITTRSAAANKKYTLPAPFLAKGK